MIKRVIITPATKIRTLNLGCQPLERDCGGKNSDAFNCRRNNRPVVYLLITLLCAAIAYLITCITLLPDEIYIMDGDRPEYADIAQTVLKVTAEPVADNIEISDTQMTLKTLGVSVKSFNLSVFPDTEVVPWGQTVGVRIDTDGVMVLGTGAVTDNSGIPHSPAEGILKSGDLLLTADGRKLNTKEDLVAAVRDSGEVLKLTFKRDDKQLEASIRPVGSEKKLGIWVRDSTQGIGTITYYNPTTQIFAALGHGIMDIDTKKLMSIKAGEIWPSNITDIKKGKKGAPGELVGRTEKNVVLGRITSNSTQGIYGTIELKSTLPQDTMKVATQSRVHEGPAVIRSNISACEIKDYDVYLENVNRYSSDSSRGMVIRITDPELLSQTGGIVQGMSGSPIIQDDRLVGAVTHVFVQDPTKGYGTFIENMLKHEKSL